MKKINRKGFTIVELVIVIAVIAILAGVLIPTFSGVVSNARHSAAQQEAKSALESALAMSSNATLPSGTLFMIDSDKDGAFDYCYVYTNNKLSDASFNGTKPYSISFNIGTDEVSTKIYDGYTYNTTSYNYTRIIMADDYVTDTNGAIKNTAVSNTIVKAWLNQEANFTNVKLNTSKSGYSYFVGEDVAFDVYTSVDFAEDICVFVPVVS